MSESSAHPIRESHNLAASPRLFRNPILDKLSRVNHWTPAILYLPAIGLLLWLAVLRLSVGPIILAIVGGYVLWTLFEYFMHKEVFHLVPPGAWGARLHFLIHGVHHDHPHDPLRLVMPPLVSVPILLVVFLVLRLVCGPDWAPPVAAGFIAGYVAYDMLHYHLHHSRPRGRWDAALRRRHMLHHFQDSARGFGISCPWWDDLLGTKPGLRD
ncbi:MAG TPA: sterol desaturase family protein [Stellaceae bacterium]|jgi:sterol desaturase/sphingolipid hydroxylase (fatty acid hydroxylase superfamily)|nr:sterol desaturase family protein [Stellaceae bacterium]